MERYNEKVFYKKTVLKNFAIFTEENLCWSLFLNKNAGFESWNFIKKRFHHRCLLVNIANFLRRLVLQNICERLFEHFPTWGNNLTSNIRIEEDIFSKAKQKNHSKTQLDAKTWLFMILLIISFFSISPLHVSGSVLPYKIKDDSRKDFKTEGLILDQWKITHLCCPLSTLLYWTRKCCIAIWIVIANTIIVAQRRI